MTLTGTNYGAEPDSSKIAPKNPFSDPNYGAPAQGGTVSDLGKSLKAGVQRLPGMATGLADLPFALAAGARPFTKAADALGEATGFQPGKWADETQFSQGYEDSKKAVDAAWKDGKASDIAGAYLSNPGYTANQVVESLPSMFAGGFGAKALMGVGRVAGVAADAAAGTAARAATPGLVARAVGEKWAAPVAGGIGEGAVTAGQQMANYQGDDQQKGAVAALGAGVGTGLIGGVTGRLANKMGFDTAETALANLGSGARANAPASLKRRVLGGMVSEGVLQELPQSAQEQMWQNFADGKPLMEGVARAGTEGALAGMVMGAGANLRGPGAQPTNDTPPAADPATNPAAQGTPPGTPPGDAPNAPPAPAPQLGYSPLAGTPTVFPDGSVALGSEAELAHRYAPQPVKPSEEMGLNPAAGPLSAAAASAVDSGAYMPPADQAPPPAPEPDPVVLQNRDRTSAASIAQMQEIAANPDYLRVGPSRDMTSGAPIVFGDLPQAALLGRMETVVDGNGERLNTQYAVVDAGDLIASNNADGTTVAEYASGAPGKLRAVAGNGRTAGLQAAYQLGTTQRYRQELEADAAAIGVDAQALAAMQRPVLVRLMQGEDVTRDMGDRTNITATQKLSPLEQAGNDARRLDVRTLAFDEGGSPTADSIKGFVSAMPVSERGDMLNPDGSPTRQAVDRLMAATFKQAYESDELVQLYAQATDPDARAVMAAAADASGVLANLKGAGEFDVRAAVADAAKMAVNAARQGVKLADVLKNADIDISPEAYPVAEFLAQNIRSPKAMAEGLRRWGQLALEQARIAEENTRQGSLLGPRPTLSRAEIFARMGSEANPTGQGIAPPAKAAPAPVQADMAQQPQELPAQPQELPPELPPEQPQAAQPQAATEATGRHSTWRKNAIQAGRVARELGLEPQGKRLAQIVAEIDAYDAAQNKPAAAGEKLKLNIFGLPDGIDFLPGTQAVPASSLKAGDWIVIDSAINSVKGVKPISSQRLELDLLGADGRYAIEVSPSTTVQRKLTSADGAAAPESALDGMLEGLDAIKSGMAKKAPPALELSAPTPAGIEAQQARQERAAKADAAAAQADDDRKRIAAASVAAADSFELGQAPMDSLTGQKDVFADTPVSTAPAQPAPANVQEGIAKIQAKKKAKAKQQKAPKAEAKPASKTAAPKKPAPVSQQGEILIASEDGAGFKSKTTDKVDSKDASPALPDANFSPKSTIAESMPTFKGNKSKMLGMAVSAIRNILNPSGITHVDDWFGGGGMWSTALTLAILPNVKTIRIAELNPLRIQRIKWMHEHGDKLFEYMQRTGALSVYRKLLAEFAARTDPKTGEHDPIVSPSPFEKIGLELAGFGEGNGGVARARSKSSGALDLPVAGKVLLSALGDLAFNNRGVKIHEPSKMVLPDGSVADKFLAKAITEFRQAHAAAQKLKARGVTYQYLPAGSSFDLVPTHAMQGEHVLSLADPPYYNTTGYKGAGNFSTGDKWNANGYAATRDLLQALTDKRNSIVYTDEAWWLRSDQMDDAPRADGILADINNTLSSLMVAPEKVGGRHEQLGIHNPRAAVRGAAGAAASQSAPGRPHGNLPHAGGVSNAGGVGDAVQGRAAVGQGDGRDVPDTAGRVATGAGREGGGATQPSGNGLAPSSTATKPAQAQAPAKRKLPPKLAAKAAEVEAQRAAYFAPGNVVASYAGHDRVVAYTPADAQGNWSVTVQPVEQQGGKWVDTQNSKPRTHSTQPDARALKAGPVVAAKANQPAAPASTANKPSAGGGVSTARNSSLMAQIRAGSNSTALLQDIARNSESRVFRVLAKAIIAKGLPFPVRVDAANSPPDFVAHYNPDAHMVEVAASMLYDLEQVLLHEAVHAITTKYLRGIGRTSELGREVTLLLNQAKAHAQKTGASFYGIKDEHEFLAEAMTNRDFAMWLDGIPASTETVLSKLVSAVAKFFGVAKASVSLAGQAMSAFERVMLEQSALSRSFAKGRSKSKTGAVVAKAYGVAFEEEGDGITYYFGDAEVVINRDDGAFAIAGNELTADYEAARVWATNNGQTDAGVQAANDVSNEPKLTDIERHIMDAYKSMGDWMGARDMAASTLKEAGISAKWSEIVKAADALKSRALDQMKISRSFAGQQAATADTMALAAAPDASQIARPLRTPVATIRAALSSAYGKLAGQLEAKGLVTLTQTQEQAIEAAAQARADKTGGDVAQIKRSLAAAMQGGTGLDVKRSANGAVQGFFDPQTGKAFMVADNLTAQAAPGVLMHEVGIHMAADKTLTPLFNRAAMLLKAQKANPFMQRVQAKMDAAGETSAEEAAAYIVEAYENDRASAPTSITKWLADMLATVKAWLHQKGILGAGSLTVADIAAVARANAKSLARGDMAGGVKFSRTPALDKNIPAFGDIRKPRESVSDVANGLSNATKVLGNRTVPMDSVVGAMSAAADDMARANDLASKLMQPDAFFERVILDDAGNVIEGQHRVTALRILGVKAIPAVVIKDYMRDFDGIAVGDAIRNAQKMGSDQSNQLVGMLAEIYADENGDMAEVVQYEPPRGYEKAWQAGIDELSKGGTGLDVKRSAIGNNGQFDPDNADIRFSRAAAKPADRPGTAQDKAVMQAIADGKSTRDVLRLIAEQSKYPFRRQVARRLLKSGITPALQFGHIGKNEKGDLIHGQYRGESDTIAIAGTAERAAEHIFLHEAMHAATMRALAMPGIASLQLRKLFQHVQKQRGAGKFYGMASVDEFVAEVFTNPDFQAALRKMTAPSGGTLKSAWDSFVRILRGILNLPNDSTNALSQALELGVAAMRDDMVLRKQGGKNAGRDANFGFDSLLNRSGPSPVDTSMGSLTPEQRATYEKVAGFQKVPTLKERMDSLKANLGLRLKQALVDQFAPIRDVSQRAYMLARMSKAGDAVIEALLYYGKPFMNDGVMDVKIGSGGFASVLASLKGEHDRFFMWVAAQRAERIRDERAAADAAMAGLNAQMVDLRRTMKTSTGKDYSDAAAELRELESQHAKLDKTARELLFDENDITSFKSLNAGKMQDGTVRLPVYAAALRELNDYNEAALQTAMESGLIDKDTLELMKSQPYVPFYRMMENEGAMGGAKLSAGLTNQKAWEKLKGSNRQLNADLLQNVMQNWSHLYAASARNRAAVSTMAAAYRMGVATRANAATKGAVKISRKGVAEYWTVEDPYLLEAISAINYQASPLMKPLAKAKSLLTFGVTISPTFKIRNLIRDSLSAISQSELGYNPLKNVKSGWKLTASDSQMYASMLASGGVIKFGSQENNDRLRAKVAKLGGVLLDQNGLQKFQGQLKELYDVYAEFGDRTENVNRVALYDQLIKNGKSHAEASFMARDLMDFSMGGSHPLVRFLTQTVPFLNARMQGLYKLGRAANEDPRKFGTMAMAVSVASVGLMALFGDDDDWKKREDWDRDAYWWFKVGETAFRIPKPFELGAIGTIAERTFELGFDDEMTGKRFMQRMSHMVAQTFALDPIPQAFKPLLDIYSNKDSFTKRAIESQADQRLRPQDRYNERTSEVARMLGSLGLPEPSQLIKGNYAALSPKQVDHLIRGYFSWLGVTVATVSDFALRPMMDRGERPDMRLKDVFVAGNFIESLPTGSSRYVSQLYEQSRSVEQAFASYREAIKTGDVDGAAQIKEANIDKLRSRVAYANATKQLSEINAQAKRIEANTKLDGEAKRERLTELELRRGQVAERLSGMGAG